MKKHTEQYLGSTEKMTFTGDRPSYAVITNDPKPLCLEYIDLFLIQDTRIP